MLIAMPKETAGHLCCDSLNSWMTQKLMNKNNRIFEHFKQKLYSLILLTSIYWLPNMCFNHDTVYARQWVYFKIF